MNEELGQIEVLVRGEKAGLGSAYRAGFAIGIERGYDVLVQMDADLSHDPSAVPPLLAALTDDVGMVIGSRYVPGGEIPHWPWHRRFLSRYGNLYTRLALGLKARDLTSGFRAWKTTTLQRIDYKTTHATGYLFQMEMAYRVAQHGEQIAEVPITFTDRVRGTSKMSGAVIFEELTGSRGGASATACAACCIPSPRLGDDYPRTSGVAAVGRQQGQHRQDR